MHGLDVDPIVKRVGDASDAVSRQQRAGIDLLEGGERRAAELTRFYTRRRGASIMPIADVGQNAVSNQ